MHFGYQLLQILQKYGNIEKFDFLYQTIGPNIGQAKGFAFVKYKNVNKYQLKSW